MNLSKSVVLQSLKRSIELKRFPIEIVGTTNSIFLSWLFIQETTPAAPRLVICSSSQAATKLAADLRALKPSLEPVILEPFDESPYSGLYPSARSLQSRTHFLWRASHAKSSDIFVCSIEGLLQKTAPFDLFQAFELHLRKGEEIDLETLCSQLVDCGYESAPIVEDQGTFSKRGGILDVFSSTPTLPIRIELFGDQIESIRLFDPETQRSETELQEVAIVPCREVMLTEAALKRAQENIKIFFDENGIGKDVREKFLEPLKQKIYPHGIDYWLPFFYEKPAAPLDAFKTKPQIYWLDSLEITRTADGFLEGYQNKFKDLIAKREPAPDPKSLFLPFDALMESTSPNSIYIKKIHVEGDANKEGDTLKTKVFDLSDFTTVVRAAREAKKDFFEPAVQKILEWKNLGYCCFVWAGTLTQAQRIKYLFETHGLLAQLVEDESRNWNQWIDQQNQNKSVISIIPGMLSESGRLADDLIAFIREDDIFGTRIHKEYRKTKGTLEQRAQMVGFNDLNPGDFIVHTLHGIGVYEGLKKIDVQGIENEFIQLKYKDNDKLYLPVYRVGQIQKYTSPSGGVAVDKLGGTSWQKAKVKVRNALKDLASELLSLYAKRQSAPGFAFGPPDDDFREFEATFPYDETPDQAKAISEVLLDMVQPKPMDRLVCGDVGFGKTEVAIRAAYKAVQDKKQVAVLVPTTILAFQHFQNFTKRFKDTAVRIAMISRFSSAAQTKKDLNAVAEGHIDILIGTHRMLSKDISFKDLGLLVVDEEQKFGVTHKEKLKKFRTQVDVLTLSATPIPRTLNMGLMGVRDLSIINTPPENRLSIRTFLSRFEEETIRKAVLSEVQRGGQVFFIHNRVQSINGLADEIKRMIPEVKLRVAHGQMPDEELEKTMLDFYNQQFDVLLCTTIIESGLDIPTANTIIIDRADLFGLAQLYQLRGRVGRSKERSYAYLLIPPQGIVDKTALERLKIIQEYTELGSGFHIAHHDLELRGSGNILGDDQSGHISAVGYELYMELLDQALNEAKGQPQEEQIEPDLNLRIPALIPDSYIDDIRIRLSYYKALSEINDESDIDKIELELKDRFGPPPEQVINLLGLMLIRKYCKDLGVKDITSGPKNLILLFTNATKVAPEAIIKLTTKDLKKYQLTPDQKLIIRLNNTTWPVILEEPEKS